MRPHAARLHVATRLNDGVDAAAPPIDVSTWFRDFNSFMDELDDDDDSVDVLDEAIPVVDAQPPASTMLSSETSTRPSFSWCDLRCKSFVIIGAGSAMGPTRALLNMGATVYAVDSE